MQGLTGTKHMFDGERKSCLRVQPNCSIDVDLVVMSFMIFEKKRRERLDEGAMLGLHDDDPVGEGGADGGMAAQ